MSPRAIASRASETAFAWSSAVQESTQGPREKGPEAGKAEAPRAEDDTPGTGSESRNGTSVAGCGRDEPWRRTAAYTSGRTGAGVGDPTGPPAITEPAAADTYSAAPHREPSPVGWTWLTVRPRFRTGSPLARRKSATSSAGSP